MDKPNIAFLLVTAILGVYVCVSLLISRLRERSRESLMRKVGLAHDHGGSQSRADATRASSAAR